MREEMSDCLVIGGGVIGMMTALACREMGASVTLIEKNLVGQEASWAGGGIVSPLYPWRYSPAVTALASWAQAAYPKLAQSCIDTVGIDPEYEPSGLAIVDIEDKDRALHWGHTHHRTLQIMESNDFLKSEPNIRYKGDSNVILMPRVAHIRNPRLMKALKAMALHAGVKLMEQCEVRSLVISEQRCQGVRTDKYTHHADHSIVCAGAWSQPLLEPIRPIGIKPVKGQMILFDAAKGLLNHILLSQGRYLIPRRDGRILVGSTLEYVGFDKSATKEAYRSLYQFATELLPRLKQIPVTHHWAGLRPGSVEGIPTIAQVPNVNGLWVNAGHFRNGLVLAPASARLMAQRVNQQEPILDPSAYDWPYCPSSQTQPTLVYP